VEVADGRSSVFMRLWRVQALAHAASFKVWSLPLVLQWWNVRLRWSVAMTFRSWMEEDK
jgi:hypothetical protein